MPSRTARLAGRPAVLLPIDPFDEDTQTAQARDALKECQEAGVYFDPGPEISEKVDCNREKIWGKWERYCRRNVVDHLKIWRDCIEDCLDRRTQAVFQGFLLDYCRSNTKRVIVLDDREVIWTYTITTKSAATEIWRTLVAAADKRAIAPLRRNATEAQRWKLRWDIKVEGTRAGPVFIIVKWIKTHLTPLLELEVDLPYSKRGFTLDDIALFVDTLWLRPHLIPLSPLQRLSVHCAVLFAGLGGFRPGMLEHLEYDQFRVILVRDGAGRRRVAVHCKIYRNKRRRAKNPPKPVQFTILAVPDPRYCVVRILISRAIQANAFEAGYKSYDELIQKPTFDGNTRIIRLNWKQHLLDEKAEILPLAYGTLWSVWHRTLLVAGYREPPRPYSMRVGAGRRLDDIMAETHRNWFMGHDSQTFQNSYMADRYPGDLLKLAFGQEEGNTDEVFAMFNNTSNECDPGAPLFLSTAQELEYDQRRIVAADQKALLAMPHGKERNALRQRMNADRRQWEGLKLLEVREEYFKNADRLRAVGLTVEPVMPLDKMENPPYEDGSSWFCIQVAKGAGEISARVDALVAFLRGIPDPSLPLVRPVHAPVEKPALKHRCLLCRDKKKTSFATPSGLSRHHIAIHVRNGVFKQPFPCPECMCVINSVEGWSNHVERHHGRDHAPSLHNLAPSLSPATSCFACDKKYSPHLYVRHLNTHIQSDNWPSGCTACGQRLEGIRAWLDHLVESHLPDYKFCPSCGFVCSSVRGATKHLLSHSKTFQAGPCQICHRLGLDNNKHFDFDSWVLHVQGSHQPNNLLTPYRDKRKAIDNDKSSPPALPKRLKPNAQGTNTDIDVNVIPHQSYKPTAPSDKKLMVCDDAAPPAQSQPARPWTPTKSPDQHPFGPPTVYQGSDIVAEPKPQAPQQPAFNLPPNPNQTSQTPAGTSLQVSVLKQDFTRMQASTPPAYTTVSPGSSSPYPNEKGCPAQAGADANANANAATNAATKPAAAAGPGARTSSAPTSSSQAQKLTQAAAAVVPAAVSSSSAAVPAHNAGHPALASAGHPALANDTKPGAAQNGQSVLTHTPSLLAAATSPPPLPGGRIAHLDQNSADAELLSLQHHSIPAPCDKQNDYQGPAIPSKTTLESNTQGAFNGLGELNTFTASAHADAAGEGDCITVCAACHVGNCASLSPLSHVLKALDAPAGTTSFGTRAPPTESTKLLRRRIRGRKNLAGGPIHGGDNRRSGSNIRKDTPQGDVQTPTRILRRRIVVAAVNN